MPPRDGDDLSAEGEDGLVAQIIPLRQREHEGEDHGHGFHGAQAREDQNRFVRPGNFPLAERSVWDQPTTELRRRTDPDSSSPFASLAHRAGRHASRPSWRLVGIAVAAATATAVLLAVTDHRGSAPRHESSIPKVNATVTSAGASSSPARRSPKAQGAAEGTRQRKTPRGRGEGDRGSSVVLAHGGVSAPAVASPRAGKSAGGIQPAAPTPASLGSSSVSRPNESAPGHTQEAPPASATTPSRSQDQCVPGELGC